MNTLEEELDQIFNDLIPVVAGEVNIELAKDKIRQSIKALLKSLVVEDKYTNTDNMNENEMSVVMAYESGFNAFNHQLRQKIEGIIKIITPPQQ